MTNLYLNILTQTNFPCSLNSLFYWNQDWLKLLGKILSNSQAVIVLFITVYTSTCEYIWRDSMEEVVYPGFSI